MLQLDPPVTLFGNACAGSNGVPSITIDGVARIGETFSLDVTNTSATVAPNAKR